MAVNASWTRVTAERARHLDRRPRRQLIARSTSRVRFRARPPSLGRHGKPRERPRRFARRGAHLALHLRPRRARPRSSRRRARDVPRPLCVRHPRRAGRRRARIRDFGSPPRRRRGVRAQAIRKSVSSRPIASQSPRANSPSCERYDPTHASSHSSRTSKTSLRLFPPPAPPRRISRRPSPRPRTRETPTPRVFILSAEDARAAVASWSSRSNISATTVRPSPTAT